MQSPTTSQLIASLDAFEHEMLERFAYAPERDHESIARGEWKSAYKHPTDAARFEGWHLRLAIQRQAGSNEQGTKEGTCMPQLLLHCRSYLTLLETLPFTMGPNVYEIESLRDAIATAEQSAAL